MDQLILALDFGGTKHTAGTLKDPSAGWVSLERAFANQESDADSDIRTMLQLAAEVLAGEQPAAVGVSFGGPVDFESGTVRLSHHVTGWEEWPLGQFLIDRFACPVVVDNDANSAALGEWRFGAGGLCGSLLFVTVSTGVGGGWIIAGRPWRGSRSMAGEIGHTVVDPKGPVCLCGKRGCVERLASGPYMAADARAAMETDPESGQILRALASEQAGTIDGRLVALAARKGDPLASHLIRRGAAALGVGLGNAANLMDPDKIILGGGVTKSGSLFWESLHRSAEATCLPQVRPEIIPAALGDEAPLWGAAALAERLL